MEEQKGCPINTQTQLYVSYFLSPLPSHTLVDAHFIPLPLRSAFMYLTLLPGGKKKWMKLIWSLCGMFLKILSEQWNVTIWKIPCLAHQLAWIYSLPASNLPTRSTCTNAFKRLLDELIAFSQVICFCTLPMIHSTLSESTTATLAPAIIHHVIPKGHILQTGPGQ